MISMNKEPFKLKKIQHTSGSSLRCCRVKPRLSANHHVYDFYREILEFLNGKTFIRRCDIRCVFIFSYFRLVSMTFLCLCRRKVVRQCNPNMFMLLHRIDKCFFLLTSMATFTTFYHLLHQRDTKNIPTHCSTLFPCTETPKLLFCTTVIPQSDPEKEADFYNKF